jgi:hypothetical protein
MSRVSVKVLFPKIKLQELLARPGGIARGEAVEAAISNLSSIREEGDTAIEAAIAQIEKIASGVRADYLSHEEMRAILLQADQIVTFAGTFGYSALDQATRDLCDVTDGLIRSGLHTAEPVLVHVKAIRMFAPSSTPVPEPVANQVLAELAKVKAHYDFLSTGPQIP